MTAIAAAFDRAPRVEHLALESALRLPAAAGMGRAFLVVHFAPSHNVSEPSSVVAPHSFLEPTDEDAQAFVSELRELGGMTVIA